MRRPMHDPGFPLFFKLWFGFIAAIIVCVIGMGGYLVYSVAASGPEGIGRAIGTIIKGVDEGRR